MSDTQTTETAAERKARMQSWIAESWIADPSLMPVGQAIERGTPRKWQRLHRTGENTWVMTNCVRTHEGYSDDPLSIRCNCPFSGLSHSHKDATCSSPEQASAGYRW